MIYVLIFSMLQSQSPQPQPLYVYQRVADSDFPYAKKSLEEQSETKKVEAVVEAWEEKKLKDPTKPVLVIIRSLPENVEAR